MKLKKTIYFIESYYITLTTYSPSYLLCICLSLILIQQAKAQVTQVTLVTENAIPTSSNGAYAVYAADVNDDGHMDLLSASFNGGTIAWYENDGNEVFTRHIISDLVSGATSVYAVDLDEDGHMDILSSSRNRNTIAWYENDGNEVFTEHVITNSASGAWSVYAEDVNGDNYMDVLSASLSDNTIAWYENDGNEVFTKHVVSDSATGAHSVYAEDVNGDNHMDVLSASIYDHTIAWYENDGNEVFTRHIITNSLSGPFSVYAEDVNGDNHMDVLSASAYDNTVAWHQNDGNEVFTKHIVSDSATGAHSVYAVDINGDGYMDVLNSSSSSSGAKIIWYENDGNEVFTEHVVSNSGDISYSVHAEDIDGDGNIDVLGASFLANTIEWYRIQGHTFTGSGTSGSPFQVSSPADLYFVRAVLNGTFQVTNDIDLNVAPYNTGEGWEPIGENVSGSEFQGVFDGNGFTIKNLFINRPTTDYAGLFEINLGVIKNIALENVDITAANSTGALVGRNYSDVDNSYATGTITATDFSGGLVGSNENYLSSTAEITNSYSLVNVNSSSGGNLGSLLGVLFSGEVNTSYASGTITGGTEDSGGLVGLKVSGTVTDSYWDIEVTQQTFSAGGTGLTTSEMQQSVNFTGFDFSTHWSPMDGAGYPHLQLFGYKKTAIHGDEGWRMFTTPSNELSYAELLDTLWTQGFTGADSESGLSNVLVWRESTQSWSIPTSASEKVAPGTGFLVYVFSDDNGPLIEGDAGFPKVHTHNSSQFTGIANPTLSYTDSGNPSADGWNLVGNPYGTTIDWDGANGWNRTNVDATIYVWSDSAGGGTGAFLTWNGIVGTLGHGKIAPWQGFWVKAHADGPSISLNDSVKSTGGTFHKKAPIPQIQFSLGDGEKHSQAVVMFHEQALKEKDALDAYKLQALGNEYLLLGTSMPGGESMDVQALPLDGSEYQLGLDIGGNNLNGDFTLSWNEIAIPDEWEIMLVDQAEAVEIPIRENSTVNFKLHEKKNVVQKQELGIPASPGQLLKRTKGVASRFELRIKQAATVSTEPDVMLPVSVELEQNYPNPFNPSTTIKFGMPTQANVRLEVFDMLGRRVAELLNKPMQAGEHTVQFDASALSSGMYIYRLQTGNTSLTQKMMLIK